jgi:hypothetical protein
MGSAAVLAALAMASAALIGSTGILGLFPSLYRKLIVIQTSQR